MINYDKITDVFCMVDDFCNDFEKFMFKSICNRNFFKRFLITDLQNLCNPIPWLLLCLQKLVL